MTLPIPIPSNVNLQKEKAVCMAFTLGSHGEHYLTGFVMLLNVVSLLAESTTGVPWVWRIQICYAAVFLHQHTQRPVTTPTCNYYTENAEYYKNTQGLYYTEEPKHYSAPSYNRGFCLLHYTNASECYMIIYFALNYYTGAPSDHWCTDVSWLFVDVLLLNLVSLMHMTVVVMFPEYGGFISQRYPCYYTGTSNYYTEKAECYTRTYATPVYYTEELKHYSAPSYNTGSCFPTATLKLRSTTPLKENQFAFMEWYTTLLPYYLTRSTHATPTYYTDARKYYISKATRIIYTNVYAVMSYYEEVSLYPNLHQQNL
ncbi:hypothetical protein DAPPUDRAFT_240027 [Daphnia pulex]|uniref:Uncharacterized protein n=1 Tax=Daphnia pulex TaxID=6669 RepID=E9GAQ0_DAPPU|nr:hypothetical protein DAPPUDRAFT_240027 [Daphnia pulex]|eukprot:EFX83503.1 hypothetical protein DAPPUDRAFT_240027 [Daphnia pulex]